MPNLLVTTLVPNDDPPGRQDRMPDLQAFGCASLLVPVASFNDRYKLLPAAFTKYFEDAVIGLMLITTSLEAWW